MLTLPMRSALAGTDDGTLLEVVTLLDNGDPADKLDLVFLGDGFRDSEQAHFDRKVDQAVAALLDSHPFLALRCAMNIHRVNVASRESGTDIPSTCDGESTGHSEQVRATAMDTTYCAGSVFRCVGTDDLALVMHWASNAPGADVVIVLINDSGYGGCAFSTGSQRVTFQTLDDSYKRVLIHELGHAIGKLGDEYCTDDPDPNGTSFTDSEPSAANLTKATTLDSLKWADLVLPSTPIPTRRHGSNASFPGDLVGTFEGGRSRFCRDVFHPQADCRMRDSRLPFCAVCRRAIVRELCRFSCMPLGVAFTELLIRDDQDPWPRGSGEIYFHYRVSSRNESVAGTWPGSEDSTSFYASDGQPTVDFDDDDTRSLNDYFAAAVPNPAPGTGSIAIRVRESDWPDGHDTLSSDATIEFSGPGDFTVDRADYRVRGKIVAADLKVLFDSIQIKDDQDSPDSGDVYVEYTMSNGSQTVHGRWPSAGEVGISDGSSAEMGLLAAALERPNGGNRLVIRIDVWDSDGWLRDGDDRIGGDTFELDASTGFGTDVISHIEDHGGYRFTYSIVGCP